MNIFNSEKKEDNNKVAPIPVDLKKNKRVAIITDEGVEDIEFFYPYYRFNEEGYEVDVITSKGGAFKGKHETGLLDSKSITIARPENYSLLYLPGGKAPAKLREDKKVLQFVKDFVASGKPVAAICHGAQILASADVIKGKQIAAWPKIEDEIKAAGATFVDKDVQEDGQFITSRKPGDLHRHLYRVLKRLE